MCCVLLLARNNEKGIIIMKFTIDEIRKIAEDLSNRGSSHTRLVLIDGSEIDTDAGWAIDGINAIVKELEIICDKKSK
jgi:hypothetical protein